MTMVREALRALVHDMTMIIVWLFLVEKDGSFRTDLNSQHQRHLHFTHYGRDPLQETPIHAKERSTLSESISRRPRSTH